jgi:hypothetical protein
MSDGSLSLIGNEFHGTRYDSEESTTDDTTESTMDDTTENRTDDTIEKADAFNENELHLRWKGNTDIKSLGRISDGSLNEFLISVTQKAEVKDQRTSTLWPTTGPAAGLPVYDTGRLAFWTSHGRILSWVPSFSKLHIQIDNEVLELNSTIPRNSILQDKELESTRTS